MTNERFVQRVLDAEASLYRVARSILHNEEDCADAAQNAILKAFDKLDTLKHEKYFATWLTRILAPQESRIFEEGCKKAALSENKLVTMNYRDYGACVTYLSLE